MKFRDIAPSKSARKALANSFNDFDESMVKKSRRNVVEKIEKLSGHDNTLFFSTCSSAIFALLKFLKEKNKSLKLFSPDQGIWKGIPRICKNLGIEVVALPTNLGVFKAEEAGEIIKKEIKGNSNAALLFSSFAGYIAEQEVSYIAEICRRAGILIIEDASGAIGDKKLGKKETCDILLCSCSYPKILNLYAGGFLACSHAELAEELKEYEKIFRFPFFLFPALEKELNIAGKRVDALVKACFQLKKRIKQAIFANSRGISAGFLCDNPKKLAKLAYEKGIRTEKGKTIITPCPKYERFLEKGFVVEVKKIDILNTEEKDINKLADKINEVLEEVREHKG